MLNLADALESHARNQPDKPAIVEGGTSLDYRGLFTQVTAIALALAARPLPPHAVVGLALRDTGLHLVLLYALARAGLVILPMDCRWTATEKENVARHFGAALVLCEPGDALAPDIPVEVVDAAWLAEARRPRAPRRFESDGNAPLLLSLSSRLCLICGGHRRQLGGVVVGFRLLFLVAIEHAGFQFLNTGIIDSRIFFSEAVCLCSKRNRRRRRLSGLTTFKEPHQAHHDEQKADQHGDQDKELPDIRFGFALAGRERLALSHCLWRSIVGSAPAVGSTMFSLIVLLPFPANRAGIIRPGSTKFRQLNNSG